MVLKLEDKKAIVGDVAEIAKCAKSLVAAEYGGLNVKQLTDFRKLARDKDLFVRVVRNTLAKRAVQGTSFECIQPALTGALILVFSKEDPGSAARLVRDYSKQNDKLKVRALALDGRYFPAEQIDTLANLPTRDEAIAQLMSVMLAPVTKFVRTLAEPHAKLVRLLAAIRDTKQ